MGATVYTYLLATSLVMVVFAAGSILNPRLYVYHEGPQTWNAAKVTCETIGGTLAIIHDVSIMPDINASVPQLQNQVTWIGLYFEGNEWKWTDNSVHDWSNWQPFSESKDGNCVSITLAGDFYWERTLCNQSKSFFCELQQGNCSFRLYQNSTLSGYNVFKQSADLGFCLDLCEKATEITCLSFEYSSYLGSCQLSDVNRWMKKGSYITHDPTWNYYHRTCIQATVWTSDMVYPNSSNSTNQDMSTPATTTTTTTTTQQRTHGVLEPHHYVVYNTSMNWYDARDFCENKGGFMATIYDQATIQETGYITQYMGRTILIGLSQTPDESWHWVEGTPLSWTNWKYQPKETDRSEKCTMMPLDDSNFWYPTSCQTKMWFMCQFPADKCVYKKTSNAVILANNKLVYHAVSLPECQELCENTTSFQCRSFEYLYSGGLCQLSDGNMWTLATYFKRNLIGWDYYHKQCNFGGPLPDVPATTEKEQMTTEAITTTDSETTTVEKVTTTKKTFTELKEELVAMGNEIRERHLNKQRTSAIDNRPSATGAGIVATIILGSILGFVVLMDIGTIKAHCDQHRGCKKKHRSRKCPPIEDMDIECSYQNDGYRRESLQDETKSNIVRIERNSDIGSGRIKLSSNHVEIDINSSANCLEDAEPTYSEQHIVNNTSTITNGKNKMVSDANFQTEEHIFEEAIKLWKKYQNRSSMNDIQYYWTKKSKSVETQTDICGNYHRYTREKTEIEETRF